ncbi:hypothetical protein KIP88_38005 [Bradyrhizobium sp. SRL28]|uniref:hypothetical protein n=1 Tax=Bradyrhizobium sp. SRL28 TaxID=2836178 RepID=UPI001BDEDE36|nr:hypothetical protein [Bradyrhizobium sp. SRL28]MBT1516253.1 hypothetical protein [Bradyrhizobium sp. SRL28]
MPGFFFDFGFLAFFPIFISSCGFGFIRTRALIRFLVACKSSVFAMDDFAPFESPKLLIDGAKTSIVNFRSACETFIESCNYDMIYSQDPNTKQKIVKLRFHNRLPALRYAAYGIVNDLRHSLDQAVCDAAVELGRPDSRGVYFPFGKTAKNLDDETAAKTKKVNADLVTFVRAFNAHYGGDDMLYALSSVAGPSKHQRILRMSLDSKGVVFGLGGQATSMTFRGGENQIGINKWNDLRNELEFCRFAEDTTGNIDARPVLQVVLGTGEPPLADPAPTALDALAGKVESIVLGIEAETARIKRNLGI